MGAYGVGMALPAAAAALVVVLDFREPPCSVPDAVVMRLVPELAVDGPQPLDQLRIRRDGPQHHPRLL